MLRMLVFLSALCPGACLAIGTLDDLFDAGGTRLSRSEVVDLIAETIWEIPPYEGVIMYRADGTFTGFSQSTSMVPGSRGYYGTWDILTSNQSQ